MINMKIGIINMDNPKVAICVSCYNHADFLPDLLSSIDIEDSNKDLLNEFISESNLVANRGV